MFNQNTNVHHIPHMGPPPTDPTFMQGLIPKKKTKKNKSSEFITTNVKIVRITPDCIEGVSEQGIFVRIHKKYLALFKRKIPPGIDLRNKKFKMVIVNSIVDGTTCNWKAFRLQESPLLEEGVYIVHKKGSSNLSESTIMAPIRYIDRFNDISTIQDEFEQLKNEKKLWLEEKIQLTQKIKNLHNLMEELEDEECSPPAFTGNIPFDS